MQPTLLLDAHFQPISHIHDLLKVCPFAQNELDKKTEFLMAAPQTSWQSVDDKMWRNKTAKGQEMETIDMKRSTEGK